MKRANADRRLHKLESRWPAPKSTQGMVKITAQLRGKLPASASARVDMLDAAASKLADARGLVILFAADEATEDREYERRERPVERTIRIKRPKLPKKGEAQAPPERIEVTTEHYMHELQTLVRDYWCRHA